MTSVIGTRGWVLIGLYIAAVLFALTIVDGLPDALGYAVPLVALPAFASWFIPPERRGDPRAYALTIGGLLLMFFLAWFGTR